MGKSGCSDEWIQYDGIHKKLKITFFGFIKVLKSWSNSVASSVLSPFL